MLADVTAITADRIRNIESEVRTASLDGIIHEQTILILGQMLIQIAVQGRATIQILSELTAMQHELIEYGGGRIFYKIEVRIIAGARYGVAVSLVPLGVFDT